MSTRFISIIMLILIACTLLLFVCMPISTAYGVQNTNSVQVDWQSWDILYDFVSNNPDRKPQSQGEQQAGDYLVNQFTSYGYDNVVKTQIFELDSYNIHAYIDTPATQKIIIGAHYDNSVQQGATDNGSGVTALLVIAQQLYKYKDSLQYDIEFVAFGAEELGLYGAQSYVDKMTAQQLDNIALMINIDSIAGGDNLYIYGEDQFTTYQQHFVDSSINSPYTLLNKPLNKDMYYGVDRWGIGYYQTIQNADQTIFRTQGVPTLLYFSGSYDTLLGSYVESTNTDNCVLNTNKDTLEHLEKLGKEQVSNKIDTVAISVINALTDSNIVSVLDNARSQLVTVIVRDIIYPTVVAGVIIVLLVPFAVLHYKKLDKKSVLGYSASRGADNKVFGVPNADDIFDMDDTK